VTGSGAPSTPARFANSQAVDNTPSPVQIAIIEAEREALEIARLEIEDENRKLVEANERLLEENNTLRRNAEELGHRLDGVPDAVAALIARIVARDWYI